jgi:hypothetical protein
MRRIGRKLTKAVVFMTLVAAGLVAMRVGLESQAASDMWNAGPVIDEASVCAVDAGGAADGRITVDTQVLALSHSSSHAMIETSCLLSGCVSQAGKRSFGTNTC